ncbi:hypothetical protein [Methylophaga nitratireducenticrescens]|uniref:Uncharacterized protein n=1 Tax=Methylophaga nitratireducenticrescens TaxID=754476 RepID=I1XFP1_METNJ|nr:hypothetical protein [Methylophaga nitratireducenticrescens]
MKTASNGWRTPRVLEAKNIPESGAEIGSLLKTRNWQELAMLPAQAF